MRKLEQSAHWGVPGAASSGDGNRRLKILFVEDDPESKRVGVMRLERHFELLVASNDREACAAYREHADAIYLILLDIQLQGSALDGMQLCQLFRNGTCDVPLPEYAQGLPARGIPVIFMTAYGHRYGYRNLASAGGNRVIEKPIDFVRLCSVLQTIHQDIAEKDFEVL
jgi:CheY-like chemotaxis protein